MKINLKVMSMGALLLLSMTFVACQHETLAPVQPPQGIQPTLSSIQANVFTPKCATAGCHVPGGTGPMSLQNGVSYTTLVNVNSAYGRLRVKPNDAANSVLYLKVTGAAGVGPLMPSGRPPLTSDEINAIQTWINNGAQNN
jgi:hypothetical protein